MTKAQKIAELKALYPTLQKGVNEEVIDLDAKEYEATIEQWAVEILAKEEEDAKAASDATAKAALLVKLGITADEAKLLLA